MGMLSLEELPQTAPLSRLAMGQPQQIRCITFFSDRLHAQQLGEPRQTVSSILLGRPVMSKVTTLLGASSYKASTTRTASGQRSDTVGSCGKRTPSRHLILSRCQHRQVLPPVLVTQLPVQTASLLSLTSAMTASDP